MIHIQECNKPKDPKSQKEK